MIAGGLAKVSNDSADRFTLVRDLIIREVVFTVGSAVFSQAVTTLESVKSSAFDRPAKAGPTFAYLQQANEIVMPSPVSKKSRMLSVAVNLWENLDAISSH